METSRTSEAQEATAGEQETRLTRRHLLKRTAGAGIVALLPMLPALLDRAQAAPEKWTTVGPAGKFPKGQPQRITVADGGVLYITRVGQATLVAVSAKCTHRGCEIGWDSGDHEFHCPCHGAIFEAGGKNVKGTRRSPDEPLPALPSVPVRQQDGQVQVRLQGLPPDELHPGGTHAG